MSFARVASAFGLLLFTCAGSAIRAADDAQPVDPERFEKELLVSACEDPMQLVPLPGGSVLFIERNGNLKRFNATDRSVQTLGTVPTVVDGEYGLMGLALAPDFEKTGWLYLDYCPASQRTTMRLSRFTLTGDRLDLAHLDLDSERKLFDYTIQPEGHMGGGLEFDAAGNLYFGTGDNSPPLPEVPLDDRPGRLNFDVLRTSGNTADLRGKVLRIHPEPDGTYTIPQGNLFPDGDKARPEIFAMGCRNPFRLSIDPKTNWVYWGDIGPNVSPEVGMGPTGYDEINQARAAGNFGWPMFVGPNEPFHLLDFATRKVGPAFDPKSPINASRNNTGRRELPPPQPAFIWYPTTESPEFPELGSGARCSMAGPVYYFDARLDSPLKLPQALDQSLLIYDWTRNWIKAVKLDGHGGISRIEPFMPGASFRKPMDMKLAADGTLYLIEYGDKWQGNRDAQIVRIVYRRGNRPPVAVADASPPAGKQPLEVHFDAGRSFDKDRDALRYAWSFGGDAVDARTPAAKHVFSRPGAYRVTLTVTDAHGASSATQTEIRVGNAAPKVRLVEPTPGGFFDWNQWVRYRVEVADEEDGGTADGKIAGERVLVRALYQPRHRSTQTDAAGRQVATDDAALEPGLALMRRTTCFSCHTAQDQSAGPPYASVAVKYADDRGARERLAEKILTGGVGAWGAKPMPPHPQHTIEQTRLMVDWVLSLKNSAGQAPVAGADGVLRTPGRMDEYADAGVFLITAAYTDQGADGAAPLTGEATSVLHFRRKKPAYADARRGVEMVDFLEGERGIMGRYVPGGYAAFEQVNLAGIDRAAIRCAALSERPFRLELHCDGPQGPLVSGVEVTGNPARRIAFRTSQIAINDPGGVHDLYLVAVGKDLPAEPIVDVNWIEFYDAPEVAARKESQQAELAKLERQAEATRPPARQFVRSWKVDDLAASLDGADRNRSFDRGQQLFKDLACAACHRLRDSGGNFGPDLTDVAARIREAAARLREKPSPRLALLTEIVEPSKIVGEKFRTHVIATEDGRRLTGLVVKETADTVTLADNPLKPDQVTQIPVAQIDERSVSTVSLMPTGLVDTLSQEEILDLLLFVESGGNAKHAAFKTGE